MSSTPAKIVRPLSKAANEGPESVQLWDADQSRIWQDYHISGMPDLIGAVNLAHVLLAVTQAGLTDRLKVDTTTSAETLVSGLNEHVANGLLHYLAVKGVVDECSGGYRLSRRGELLTSPVALARLGFYLEAYGPITASAGDLLTGAAKYGVDVSRKATALAQHSGTVSTTSYSRIVIEAMRDHGARTLLDLGCGGGSLLVDVCRRDANLTGIGIDVSLEAVDAAQRLAEGEGVADRVSFAVADAFDPDSWPSETRNVDMICGVGVLHELFRDGDEAVRSALDRYAAALNPGGFMLIGEPELRYDDRENDSDFFLVHVLSDQGIPRGRGGWLQLFPLTLLKCVRVWSHEVAGPRTLFYELHPRNG